MGTLWTTAFTVAPDASVADGDTDLRTLTGDGGSYTPTTISAGAITALNLASPYGTHTVQTKTSQDFEAGVIKSRRYGGFFDEGEKKEQDPDKGAGFCANDIANPSFESCAGLDQTTCGTTTGCNWHGTAVRASSALWSYPVSADASDNYRCQNLGGTSCTALKVYYQLTEDSTKFEWALASAGGVYESGPPQVSSTGTHNIVMKPGKKVRISWFVDDSAGDFGFKQMSNPQTHTIQFYVTDKTRPIITPAQKATCVTASATTDFQTNAAGFASNPTLLDDAELAALGYASVKCSQINDAKLCTGTCTWNAASGCAGADTDTVLQSCVSKVSSATADDTQCWSKTTASDCWTVKNKCFWTTSQTFVDNGDYVTSEAGVTTCESPLVEYSYYVPDCTLTNDAAKKHNAKRNAGSIQWTAANTMKYTEHKKCRPANNVVDRSSLATASKNAYTIVVECGYKEGGSRYTTAVSDTDANVKSGYQEFGARAFDNWDNVHVVTSSGSSTTTAYKNIDLFTDGASTCTAADNAWVSCERSASTPGKPSTGDYNTLSYNTKSMGKGGYGAVYNGQLVRDTASTASRWPQRGLYHRSGLLNCAPCDAKDFKNDFLVVYRYTDQSENSARPLMRKVVTRDTTPPTVKLIGDQTLENSAGSYVHSTASSNEAQCVQKTNRSAACDTDHSTEQLCNADAACIWSYEDADNYAANQDGLFDQDRIITYFKHRDDCDKDIVTTVAMYSGLCPTGSSDTRTKITCDAASSSDTSACYAGFFQYRSAAADSNGFSDAFEQPDSDDNLMSATDTRMQKFPEWTAGDYSITYEAMDSAGLKHSVCRNIYNVDHTFPIIQILGSDQMTLEATHQGNYIDDGATCSDQVDGVISQNVEVSGDVVNLSKVGTYTITYNCKDSANNAAPAAQRTVVVAQTSCPKCTVHGPENKDIIHEASFPYSDAGASCSDVIDGDVPTLCFTAAYRVGVTGDGVVSYGGVTATGEKQDQWAGGADRTGKGYCDEMEGETDANCVGKTLAQCTSETTCKWNQYSPCGTSAAGSGNLINDNADSGSTHAGAQIGTYYITYRAKNTVGLYNDGENCRGGAQEYVRKVTVKDTLRPVITLKYDSSSDGSGSETVAQGTFSAIGDTTTEDLSQTDTLSDKLYPSVKDAVYESQNTFDDTWTGKGYCAAKADAVNPNTCKFLAVAQCTENAENCEWKAVAEHGLMAEESTSSVNGWVMGAIASAVAGLALLGYSTRRTAVATSVPV